MTKPQANRCPRCRRYFTTPQGLGMHFAWMWRIGKRRIGKRRCKP